MKRALVTGGAGFIGSNLCERLLKEGYFVYCLDNFYSGRKENIIHLEKNPNFLLVFNDVCTMSDLEIDEIYNLACPASPLRYQSNPVYTVLTSINGAIKTAELASKLKIKLFHASTSEVYGEPLLHPQSEEYWGNVNPIGIRSCYDEGKRLAESIMFSFYRRQPFPLKVGRIFNTYGPRMHQDDGRAISSFIRQALTNEDLSVFGDGNQTRSFCYIDDLIDAILLLMKTPVEFTGPVNLGNDNEHSLNEIAKIVMELTGTKSKISYHPLPADDPSRRRPNLALARKMLNWNPKISLEEGVKRSIEYYKEVFGIRN